MPTMNSASDDASTIETATQPATTIDETVSVKSGADPMPTTAIEKVQTSTTSVNEPYTVFSGTQKLLIVAIVAVAGLISPISGSIYVPTLTAVQKDLNTTAELVNLTVTTYMIFQGLSPSFWGPLADLWGRRPIYLMTMVIYVGACIGIALTPNLAGLMVLRMLQAFGSSSVIAVGAGTVSDISTPANRGTYYGLISLGQQLGPVIGPVIGGVVAGTIGWRWLFWILTIYGAVAITMIFFFLPETLRLLVGNGSGYANPTPFQWLKRRRNGQQSKSSSMKRFRRFPNFLSSFLYILQPDVGTALLFNGVHFAIFYCFMTSASSLLSNYYGLSEIQVGVCYLSLGCGSILGSFFQGRLLDHLFKATQRKTGIVCEKGKIPLNFPLHRVRLRTAWYNSLLTQAVTIGYGWAIYTRTHLAVPLILQFIFGFNMSSVSNSIQTFLVDLFPGKGASITASNNVVRCLLGAVSAAVIELGIQGVGVGWMFTTLGLVLTCSCVLLVVLQRFGPQWRKARVEKQQARERARQQTSAA